MCATLRPSVFICPKATYGKLATQLVGAATLDAVGFKTRIGGPWRTQAIGRTVTIVVSSCRPGCSSGRMSLSFRCFAYRSRQSWEAICADLDIAVFGDTINEVVAYLEICIQMHLEGVYELPPGEQDPLLVRRSPWYVWIKLAVVTWLSGPHDKEERARRFTVDGILRRIR